MSGVVDVTLRTPKKMTLAQRLYLPEILAGMGVTIRHFLRNLVAIRRLPTILYPEQKRDYVSVFMELSRRQGDFAIAGLACYARFEREIVSEARLVYFGSEVKPTLALRAMAAIQGRPWSPAISAAACAALAEDLNPIDNTFGRPATKLHLQRVLTQRALAKAVQRASLQ